MTEDIESSKKLIGCVFDPKNKSRKELVDEIMTWVETQKKIIAEERAAAAKNKA